MTRFFTSVFILLISLSALSANRAQKIFNTLEPISDSRLEDIGQKSLSHNSYDTAFAAFTILHERFAAAKESDKINSLANALNGIGIIWFMKGDYRKAYYCFKKAESAGSPEQTVNALNNLASMYYYFRDYKKCHQYYEKAFRLAYNLSDWERMSLAAMNLMNLEFEREISGKVSPSYFETLENFKGRPDNPRTRFIEFTGRAMRHAGNGEYLQAEKLFSNSLVYADSMYMPVRHKYNVYVNMARTAFLAGDCSKELDFLNKAYEISSDVNFTELKIDILGKLADYHERHGNNDLSKKYRYRKYALSDSSFTATEMKKMYDVDLEMEADKYEKRINVLDVNLKWRGRWMLILTILLLLTVGFVFFIYRHNRMLKEKNRSLFNANREITEKMALEKMSRSSSPPPPR